MKIKKLILVISAITFFCAILCVGANARWDYECINCAGAEGLHGENVKWYFDAGSGTLTLEGEGYMSRHAYYADGGWEPWDSVVGEIKHVVIGEGIVNVGLARFACLNKLETVTLANSVKVIEEAAFANSPNLKSITMSGVTTIGESAFSGCGFVSVEIPDNVTSIGDRAYALCYSLESVDIGDGVEVIGDSAFVSCSKLSSLNIGESVSVIEELAFNGCSLVSLTLPEGIEEIGDGAFSYTRIEELTLPNSLKTLGYGAFSGCRSLLRVTILGATEIGGSAFGDCYSVERVDILGPVVSIGNYTFHREPIKEVHISDVNHWLGIEFASATANPAFSEEAKLYLGGELLTELVVPEGTTKINNYAFYYNDDLTSVSFPKTLRSVGEYAFCYCGAVSFVDIPDSVSEIGACAFSDMASLESVRLGTGIVSVAESAFYNWNVREVHVDDLAAFCNIKFATASSNPLYGGTSRLFLKGEELTELVIGEDITSIGAYAFYSCSSITSVALGENVTEIGVEAFYDCNALKNVIIGGGADIGARAFYNCYKLEKVTLSEGIDSIGDSAFYSCVSLEGINIPASVKTIEQLAFYNCAKLVELTLPGGVEVIGRQAFDTFANLTLRVKVGSAAHIYAKANHVRYKLYDYIAGDVDGDGKLTNADIALAIRAASGWEVGYGADTADLDMNGTINNRELMYLIKELV